jgi:Acyl-protein synthetase, LuxE
MSSSSDLSDFAARLRQLILGGEWDAWAASKSDAGSGEVEFEALALELFALQFAHNAPYRRLCEARGTRPETVAHWTEIPAVPTSAFKELALSCLPAAERTVVFHSSGTTGQRPSRHFHNAMSLAVYEASLLRWFQAHFQECVPNGGPDEVEPRRGDELEIGDWKLGILTPPPAAAPHSSLVHMFETVRRELGMAGSRFVGQVDGEGAWALDLDAAVEVLREACCAGQSLLLLGTAFSYLHLLDHLAEAGLRFKLPSGSCALETGGYKGRSRSVPKAELHRLIGERLGIPGRQIVCEYGMSELSSQAYDTALGSSRLLPWASRVTHHASRTFRFPPWARVQIVSPETGREVGEGETGLIRVFDLANVFSVMAIQTEDLGVRDGKGFALAGRAVLAEARGCSLMAV